MFSKPEEELVVEHQQIQPDQPRKESTDTLEEDATTAPDKGQSSRYDPELVGLPLSEDKFQGKEDKTMLVKPMPVGQVGWYIAQCLSFAPRFNFNGSLGIGWRTIAGPTISRVLGGSGAGGAGAG